MFDVNVFRSQVNQIRKDKRYVTNCFLSIGDLLEMSKEETSVLAYNSDAIALGYTENGVNRLVFYLSSLDAAEALKELLKEIPHRPLVADCVGKQEYLDSLTKALCGIDFSMYTKMSRWRSSTIHFFLEAKLKDEAFEYAESEDSEEILKLLYDTFDPFVSQLPSLKKMNDLIEQKLVFRVRRNGQLIAAVCFEKTGKNGIYIYQDAVVKEYQATGIGILLLQFALYQFRDCSNFTSWTEDSNKASNRMHRMMKMEYDGLHDTILLYK